MGTLAWGLRVLWWLRIFGLGSFGIFGLGSWIFGFGSLVSDLWLWIFRLESLDLNLWLVIFSFGSLAFGLGELGS